VAVVGPVGMARVSLYFEDDAAPATMELVLPPLSRTNLPVGAPAGLGGFGDVVRNRRFSVLVESVPAAGQSVEAQIVVERAMYSDGLGAVRWAAGTDALATRLR
jgi:hypothetical protein